MCQPEKMCDKAGKSGVWTQSMTLQLKEYLNDNFVFRYNTLTGATEYRTFCDVYDKTYVLRKQVLCF